MRPGVACPSVVTLGTEPDQVQLRCQYTEGHFDDHAGVVPGQQGVQTFYWDEGTAHFEWVSPETVQFIKRQLGEA